MGLKILYLDINGSAYFQELPENLVLIKVRDWYEQNEIMNLLFRSMKISHDLIFIGGLTTHYHAEFLTTPNENKDKFYSNSMKNEDTKDKVHAELTNMIYQLAMLARRNNIPIIASNSTISKRKYYIPFIGGAAVGYYSKTVLFIKPIDPYPSVINRNLSKIIEKFGYENVWILGVEKDPSPLISNRVVVLVLEETGNLKVACYYDDIMRGEILEEIENKHIFHSSNKDEKRRNVVTSGFPTLDYLMEGGFHRAEITLLFGPTMIGKSSLLRQISVKTAEKGYKILYLDLENSFDPSVEIDFYAVNVAHDLVNVFQRIDIQSPESPEKLNEFINHLIHTHRSYDLLIVDWITFHFYPLIRVADPAKRYLFLDLLENIVRSLQYYASITNSAVIIVTGTRRAPGKYPSLGGVPLYDIARRIIKIMPTKDWSMRKLTVINKTSHKSSTSKNALMCIGKDGRIRIILEGEID